MNLTNSWFPTRWIYSVRLSRSTDVKRDFKTVAKKISHFQNHLVLLLRCLHSGIQFRCPVNSKRAIAVIMNTEWRLLNEKIRVINSKLIGSFIGCMFHSLVVCSLCTAFITGSMRSFFILFLLYNFSVHCTLCIFVFYNCCLVRINKWMNELRYALTTRGPRTR